MEWTFDLYEDPPSMEGWYAVLTCWDPQEDVFADAKMWTGSMWLPPDTAEVTAWAGPFTTRPEALAWADANNPA
jgi:hypothetical protein